MKLHPKLLHHLLHIESVAAHLLIASGFDVAVPVFSVGYLPYEFEDGWRCG